MLPHDATTVGTLIEPSVQRKPSLYARGVMLAAGFSFQGEESIVLRIPDCEPARIGNRREVMDVATRADEFWQIVLNAMMQIEGSI